MCDFSNFKPNKVKEHIETYHEKILQFKCTKCTFSESWSCDIYKHINIEHNGKSKIKCTECAFISTKLSNLNIHMKITHEEVNVFEYESWRCLQKRKFFDKRTSFEVKKSKVKTKEGNVVNNIKANSEENMTSKSEDKLRNIQRNSFILRARNGRK